MRRIDGRSRRATSPLRPAIEAGDARFRALIEAAADGVIVVSHDGTIRFVNPAACTLMGRPLNDLVGHPFGIPIVPGETTEVDVVCGGAVRVAEMRAVRIQWRDEPAHLASLRDTTERKQAEEAAREVLATLRSFYDSAPMMMGVVELVGDDVVFISSNAATARFFGRGGEGLDGERASRLVIAPEVFAMWLNYFREAERVREPIRFEYQHAAAARPAWLSATVGYIGLDPSGRPLFSFVVEDVTERKQVEEALRQADRRKDEFLAMLAHELRNPLAAISSAVELAGRGEVGAAPWSQEILGRQCTNLARLIDDLMDVSRISRGRVRLSRQRIDAAAVLRCSIESVRSLVAERRHELVGSWLDGLWVDADPTRLEQIVVNLLTNAAKYTQDGGHIWLSAGYEDDHVVIRVRDDGIGIPPQKLPEMFDLFVQGERDIARSEGGLGIGLTLVKKLTELHGGRITAVSEGPGKGSEFTVLLAAAKPPPPPADPPAESVTGRPSPAAALRILVVDDNRDAACLTAALLESHGHSPRCVHDGESALQTALSFQPDVVLLDIGLPGMDGYQVAAAFRKEPAFSEVRVIAVSGYGDEQAVVRSKQAGFDHYLVKPVNIDAMLALIAAPVASPGASRAGTPVAD